MNSSLQRGMLVLQSRAFVMSCEEKQCFLNSGLANPNVSSFLGNDGIPVVSRRRRSRAVIVIVGEEGMKNSGRASVLLHAF